MTACPCTHSKSHKQFLSISKIVSRLACVFTTVRSVDLTVLISQIPKRKTLYLHQNHMVHVRGYESIICQTEISPTAEWSGDMLLYTVFAPHCMLSLDSYLFGIQLLS